MVYKANQLSLKNNLPHHLKTVSLIQHGCPKNQVLAEKMIFLLQQKKYRYSPFQKHLFFNLLIVNTCGFLKSAREETDNTLQMLSSYHNAFPETKIVIVGCDAVLRSSTLKTEFPQFDFLDDQDVVTSLNRYLGGEESFSGSYQTIASFGYAYLQIADGCDHRCSYCLIPTIKGSYKSFPSDLLLQQTENLIERYFIKEIILVAQDTTSYGKDLPEKSSLLNLVDHLSNLNGLQWIRLLYHFPIAEDHFFEELLSTPKVVPYLDIPLQHFSPAVLKNMNRPFPIEPFVEKLVHLRKKFPQLTLRSTFIVGYPTETENDFQYLLDSLAMYPFDRAGFFAYSPEPDTKASSLQELNSDQIKQERLQIAYQTQKAISNELNQSWLNQTLPALLENYDPLRRCFFGRTQREAPDIDPQVMIHASVRNPRQLCGEIHDIVIEQADAYHIQGRLLQS